MMRVLRYPTAVGALLVAGCGSQVDSAPGSASGSQGGAGVTASASAGTQTSSSATSSATGGGSGGAPASCGMATCAPDELCHDPRLWCDFSAQSHAVCIPKPAGCTTRGAKACGCDGKVYDSECAAAQQGVDIGAGCAVPAGTFACGAYFCDMIAEYCLVLIQPDETGPTPKECRPYPASCTETPPTDCACFAGEVSGCLGFGTPTCDASAGGVTYSC